MTTTTALDLSTRRYALATQLAYHPWYHQGPRPAQGSKTSRLKANGRELLLSLAAQSTPLPDMPLRRRMQARRLLRRATHLAHRHRKAIVMGTETCAFGTFLATFLSCLWLLG